MRTLFIYFVLSGGLLVVYAFPSYRNHFPNADRVPCYEGAEGCYVDQSDKGDASFCYGVGHSTCQGGTMPLNPFGKAAEHAGAKWTRDLCEADSDGDGQTNGEELGDPCCLWQQDDTPSDYMMLHTPSHPGVAVHFQENYSRPSCSITAPSKKAEALGQFNEWEEQRFVDLVIDNYEIPAKKTTYVEFAFNFPDDSRGMFHVVFAEAIVDQPAYLHHFVIIECSEKWPPELHGKRVSSYGTCNGLQWFWAPGADIVASPQYAGRAIGSDAGVVAFHVQVHYDNSEKVSGVISNDGFRIYYTPTLRDETLTSLAVNQLSYTNLITLEPHKPRLFITRSCELDVVDKLTQQPAQIYFVNLWYHAHLTGREMYFTVTKQNGTVAYSNAETLWHFDDQFARNLLPLKIEVESGDHIQATCVFNTIGRNKTTEVGRSTQDEMCWAFLYALPGSAKASCRGHLWKGELNETESGLTLAATHPEESAELVLDGTHMLTGGNVVVKGGSEAAATCGNTYPQSFCLQYIPLLTLYGATCLFDVSGIIGLSSPTTAMDLCCDAACESICLGHELCRISPSPTPSPPTPSPTPSPSPPKGKGPKKRSRKRKSRKRKRRERKRAGKTGTNCEKHIKRKACKNAGRGDECKWKSKMCITAESPTGGGPSNEVQASDAGGA